MSREIESDEFAMTVENILELIGERATKRMPEVIGTGTRRTATYWRRRAKKLWGEKTNKTYRKGGKVYKVGKYSRSIRSHMVDKSVEHPAGEVGAPNMPGLPHLLENGHNRVGGGRVNGIEHIRPAAQDGFKYTIKLAENMLDEVLDES